MTSNTANSFIQSHITKIIDNLKRNKGQRSLTTKNKVKPLIMLERQFSNVNSFVRAEDIFEAEELNNLQTAKQRYPSKRLFSKIEARKDLKKYQIEECKWMDDANSKDRQQKRRRKMEKRTKYYKLESLKQSSEYCLVKLNRSPENFAIASKVLQKILQEKKKELKEFKEKLPQIRSDVIYRIRLKSKEGKSKENEKWDEGVTDIKKWKEYRSSHKNSISDKSVRRAAVRSLETVGE